MRSGFELSVASTIETTALFRQWKLFASNSDFCSIMASDFCCADQWRLGEGNGEVRELSAQTQHRWRRLFWGSPARLARRFGCGDKRNFYFSAATTREHPRARH